MSLWDRIWRRTPAAPATDAPLPAQRVDALSALGRRETILATAINPALGWLTLRGLPSDDRARVMLLAITGQEADAQFRRQHGDGPARGLWQFERGGGVAGVLSHRATQGTAAAFCASRGVAAGSTAVHPALERDDVLAAGFARLLLWTDPKPLPAVTDADAGFAYYVRNWRPGAYTRGSDAQKLALAEKWRRQWALAREALG